MRKADGGAKLNSAQVSKHKSRWNSPTQVQQCRGSQEQHTAASHSKVEALRTAVDARYTLNDLRGERSMHAGVSSMLASTWIAQQTEVFFKLAAHGASASNARKIKLKVERCA